MIPRRLPFLANSPEVSGTVTGFAIVDCKLDPTRKLAVLTVALDWVLSERATKASDAVATPWRATFFSRDTAGRTAIVAVAEVLAADAAEERDVEGRQFRFHVEVEFGLSLDAPLPALEATIRRVEPRLSSPSGDMIGFADTPDLDPARATFAQDAAGWFRPPIAQAPGASVSPPAPREAPTAAAKEAKALDAPGPVDAAVFCPLTVGRATHFLAQVFLYPPAQSEVARERAREGDAGAERRGVLSLLLDVPVGTHIDVRLEMPGLLVDEADAALIWRETLAAAQFEVAVPADAPLGTTIGRVRFAVAGVPAGTLRFQVTVAAGAASEAARAAEITVRRYRRAFVSYSSKDRAEVLRRVQAFRIAGLSVFQDVLDLEPGDRWDRELYREIDNCDVVLLFWSRAAAASPWVAKEIDYALARKQGQDDRPPDIQPVPIEGPPIPTPPEKLRHLHFNDALLAHIAVAGGGT
jgi:hypothetical protein